MALVAPAMNPAGYAINNAEDRETGSGFEFTRRKRWPNLLLQELVGSALFCLKPVSTNQGSSHSSVSGYGWKMVYVSPAVGEMLKQQPSDLEGKDFFDLVFAPDQPQLQNLFTSLVLPTPPLTHQPSSNITTSTSSTSLTPPNQQQHTSGQSYTTYVRMMADTPVVWELRAHTTGPEPTSNNASGGAGGTVNFGYGGNGALVPQQQEDTSDGMKGKAVWVMGRRAVENMGEEAKAQSLDAFLELKLENERLREELKKLQQDLDDEDIQLPRPVDPGPLWPNPASPGPSSPSPSDDSSTTSSPALKSKPAKKRQKKASVSGPAGANGAGGAGAGSKGGGGEAEGLHVCVTCGRTDSPEWRKGPLGPKTLCNACGLRWAKRNSTAPTRKEKKAMAEGKAA